MNDRDYSGWIRVSSRHPWRKIVANVTEEQARGRVNDAVAQLPISDVYVGPSTIDPNERHR